ncbi:hypothetical protein, partial [Acinetobacter baumannii]|uniref:hypothetical protein n=1 Tax=Acinetobacter baumannii TaxID=470 RepID=UPI00165FF69C
YILRNHMAQRAIEAAERDDFSEVDRLFKLLNHPYTKQSDLEKSRKWPKLVTVMSGFKLFME